MLIQYLHHDNMEPHSLFFDPMQMQSLLGRLLALDKIQRMVFYQLDLTTTYVHLTFLPKPLFYTFLSLHHMIALTEHDVYLLPSYISPYPCICISSTDSAASTKTSDNVGCG